MSGVLEKLTQDLGTLPTDMVHRPSISKGRATRISKPLQNRVAAFTFLKIPKVSSIVKRSAETLSGR